MDGGRLTNRDSARVLVKNGQFFGGPGDFSAHFSDVPSNFGAVMFAVVRAELLFDKRRPAKQALRVAYPAENGGNQRKIRRKEKPRYGAVLCSKYGAPPGTRTPNQLIKSQLLYH